MTRPRYIVPGSTLLVTRRTHMRRFALRPSKKVNQLLKYLLAEGTRRFGLRLHGFVFMSNHFHLLVTDVLGNFPAFAQWFDSLLARALNVLHGTRDSVFSPSNRLQLSIVTDPEAVMDRLAYIAANPVADGAVRHGREWPGLRSKPADFGREETVKRPAFFFRRNGSMPPEATLRHSVPSTHSDLSPREFGQRAARAIGAAEAAARERRIAEGRGFLGAQRCRALAPLRLASRHEERGRTGPQPIVSRDSSARAHWKKLLSCFYQAYASARDLWVGGARSVVWPRGTWKMAVTHGAQVRSTGPP